MKGVEKEELVRRGYQKDKTPWQNAILSGKIVCSYLPGNRYWISLHREAGALRHRTNEVRMA
jgi:hypothetical protein